MRSSDLRLRARQSLAGNWWPSVLAAFIAAIFGSLLVNSSISIDIDSDLLSDLLARMPRIMVVYLSIIGSFAGILSFAAFILGGVVQLGYAQYLLKQYDGQDRSINDLFSQFDRFGQGFLQAFLRGLYTFLWALLFIIPGIVKAYSYAMTPFIMAENPNMTAKEAINASKIMMDGHKWELFCLGFSFIGWNLLNALTLGIGSLFLNPYTNAAYAAFYRSISSPDVFSAE